MFFDLASEVLFDKAFSLFRMNAVQTESVLAMVCFVIAFSEVELVFPWIKNGSTPGGLIVRMSFETRERSGGKRVLFYFARGVPDRALRTSSDRGLVHAGLLSHHPQDAL